MELINYNLIKHPINWVTVILMVLIGAMALHFVLKWGSSS
jgi:hypothetical protein